MIDLGDRFRISGQVAGFCVIPFVLPVVQSVLLDIHLEVEMNLRFLGYTENWITVNTLTASFPVATSTYQIVDALLSHHSHHFPSFAVTGFCVLTHPQIIATSRQAEVSIQPLFSHLLLYIVFAASV